MCGILGYVGQRPAVEVLIHGLKRLEYRGYDSAGVAFFRNGSSGGIEILKSEGKIANVEKLLANAQTGKATCGIGHTRWATHGRPTTQNAHPHCTGNIVLVHNGIIENFQAIREGLIERGHRPQTETDSELFGFLVQEEMQKGARFVEAVRRAFLKLEGACSVVVMSETDPGVVVGVRNGSPLVAARDPNGGVILASDAQPLLEYTQDVIFLENSDVVVATREGMEFLDVATGRKIERKSVRLDWSAEKLDKKGYRHYMLKEIFEQPQTFVDTLNGTLDRGKHEPFSFADQPGVSILQKAKSLTLIGCGTAWHAALLGKLWIEKWAGIPVNVELASEFRYRDPVITEGTVVVGISQSGETADTLGVIREMRRRGVPTLAITNVRGNTISREADATFFTFAGPEIGVAATKTFYAQMLMLFLWAGHLGARRGYAGVDFEDLYAQLIRLPHLLEGALVEEGPWVKKVREIARKHLNAKGFFFIGRGSSFPLTLEGALKLKEIAYVHAEGYAAGELKHGPIAMIDEGMSVVVIAPRDGWREKTISNLQEVKARGAQIIGLGSADDAEMSRQCHEWIPIPVEQRRLHESFYPFLVTPALQLLSYEIAVLKGTDVDQPRNLAKSVTVE